MYKWLKETICTHREIILYIVFGGITTLTNWIVYTCFVAFFKSNVEIASVVAWIVAVLVAYVTNHSFVFKSQAKKAIEKLKEIVFFIGSRIFSGIMEIGGFLLLYYMGLNQTLLGIDGFVAKVLISILVIVFNYVISKFLIFRGGGK